MIILNYLLIIVLINRLVYKRTIVKNGCDDVLKLLKYLVLSGQQPKTPKYSNYYHRKQRKTVNSYLFICFIGVVANNLSVNRPIV